MDDAKFIVRAWPVNSKADPVDQEMPSWETAVEHAYALAGDRRYHKVIVTDALSMVWAQFNLLWMLDPAPVPR